MSNLIENPVIFDQIWPFLIKFDLFSIKSKFQVKFWVRICFVTSQRLNRTALIGSKKLIKKPFKSDFKRNLAWGQLDRISLLHARFTQTIFCCRHAGICWYNRKVRLWWPNPSFLRTPHPHRPGPVPSIAIQD